MGAILLQNVGGGSLVWNQYIRPGDADVKF